MSSYHDAFGNGPENYDDDPDGVEAERREVENDIARNPEAYGLLGTDSDESLDRIERDAYVCPENQQRNPRVIACAHCGREIDPAKDHECREMRRFNQRIQ